MAKLLKPLVVIVLLLAIAALCIQAFVLFPKRTLIKDRTQKLETGIDRVVKTLKSESSLLSDEAKEGIKFRVGNLKAGTVEDLPRLDRELNVANAAAEAVLIGWQATQDDLEATRLDLENCRAELEKTRGELEDARTQIVQLNDIIRSKDAELAEKSDRIAMLEDEKASLEVQLTDLNEQIAGLQDDMAAMEEEKAVLEAQLKKYDEMFDETIDMKPGTSAVIVYANADWNFVVIDIGSEQGADSGAEMIVYRGENMVGKIRLSAVQDQISIAEVLTDYQTDVIREGDDVLY